MPYFSLPDESPEAKSNHGVWMINAFYIIFFFVAILPAYGQELICESYPDSKGEYSRTEYRCDQNQKFLRISNYFLSTNTKSREHTFVEGRLIEFRSWDIYSNLASLYRYIYPKPGHYFEQVFGDLENSKHVMRSKNLYQGEPSVTGGINSKSKKLSTWTYDAKNNDQLQQIDRFLDGHDLVVEREIYTKSGDLFQLLRFHYSEQKIQDFIAKPYIQLNPDAMDIYDSNRNFLRSVDPSAPLDFADIEAGLIGVRGKKQIVIIDSGFDVYQKMLSSKFWLNPIETNNGIDDDGNQWKDDFIGWNLETNSSSLLEPIILESLGRPHSHGTHVASLAMRDISDFAFTGFAGDMSEASYLAKISKHMQKYQVQFSNMSFAFGTDENGLDYAPFSTQLAIMDLIRENPQTLHVIAAGNESVDLDKMDSPPVPVSSPEENTLIVGAINSADLELSMYPNYQVAKFSNYGSVMVDILAPGEEMIAAAYGGGVIAHSGTSMAAPFILNICMKIAEIHPKLTNQGIKELIMKTAFIPNLENPLPVRSGGIVFPQRAFAVANLLAKSDDLSIESAVLQIRRTESYTGLKANSEDFIRKLATFWQLRESPNLTE